jgi:uncharacterized membrane protein YbhN (UPF0104 family)
MISVIRTTWSRPWVRRTVTAVFLTAVSALIAKQATTIAWSEVLQSIQGYRVETLALAASLALASYLIYSCFDLLGRHYIGVKLPIRSVLSAAFVSYAFNQSLGSLIGAVAFRLRIYSRLGLDAVQISKIIIVSIVTNWFGYSVLAGVIFCAGWISIPNWHIGDDLLRCSGALMLFTAAGYLLLCALGKGRQIRIKNQLLPLPGIKLALSQLFVSVIHWPIAAAIIYVLLRDQIEFVTVLGALLLTAIAAVLTHIPAGIGVLEAIFLGLLSRRMPGTEVLAALMVFRVVYYLAPLSIATIVYLNIETFTRLSGKERPAVTEQPNSNACSLDVKSQPLQ